MGHGVVVSLDFRQDEAPTREEKRGREVALFCHQRWIRWGGLLLLMALSPFQNKKLSNLEKVEKIFLERREYLFYLQHI
jgi:hypothetical protein